MRAGSSIGFTFTLTGWLASQRGVSRSSSAACRHRAIVPDSPLELERRKPVEFLRASANFAQRERLQTLHPKFFHRETPQHRPKHHSTPQRFIRNASRAGQIAHKSAGKTIAGAGRIVHLFERKPRHREQKSV